jgi:hypothetical protein
MDHGVKGATYRIVFRGELDQRFAYLFNGMQMERVEGTTVLTGRVLDQAQLHGYIERLEELRLELLSVEQLRGYGMARDRGADQERNWS